MIKEKKCLQCKVPYYGTDRAKFCKPNCRIKYWRHKLDKQALKQHKQAKAQSKRIDEGK